MPVKPTHFSPPCYILLAVFLILLAPPPSSCKIPPCHEHCLSSTLSGGQVTGSIRLPKRVLSQVEPGISIENLGHHAGYIKLPHGKDSRLFYFFFESRTNKSDPVLLWLTGWRSCESALFYENGPFHMSDDNSTFRWNHFGWDKATNLVYVDQPTNIGFSYTTDDSNAPSMEQDVIDDLYTFIQGFFKEHPEYLKNDFYIAGESHAGHFNPLLAERIRQGNKEHNGIHIKLKGFAMGNALTNPEYQFASYPDYALEKGLINDSDHHNIIKKLLPRCLNQTKICNTAKVPEKSSRCYTAFHVCGWYFDSFRIKYLKRPINYYDIRSKEIYNFSRMETFLNRRSVQKALGVSDRVFFQDLNPNVYWRLRVEWMERRDTGIPAMLEDGIKVLVYAGEFDLMYNWLGNWRWVHALEWTGKKAFNSSPNVSFTVDGSNAGLLKSHGPLAFLKVYNAGRMVPMDQPNVGLEMVRKWVHGNLHD